MDRKFSVEEYLVKMKEAKDNHQDFQKFDTKFRETGQSVGKNTDQITSTTVKGRKKDLSSKKNILFHPKVTDKNKFAVSWYLNNKHYSTE